MLLHETVTRQAARRPDATALVSAGERVSYRQLNEWSNQLARLLMSAGCVAGDRVGILLPKSVPAIVGILGTLKFGGIYVPMDTRSPAARLAKMIESAEPRCILVAGDGAELLGRMRSQHLIADSIVIGWLDTAALPQAGLPVAFQWGDLSSASPAPVELALSPDAPAHILFTSGSTGTPKGVVITHANVNHFIDWATRYFRTEESDRISCHPPLHFDLSTYDIYGTFLAGAELHLVPAETSLLPHRLAEFIRASGLTQWFSVPSVLKFMAQFDVVRQEDFPALKRVLWCGEALPTPTLIYWMTRLPGVEFTNLYGPTETTIASSYYTIPACPRSETAPIPIGLPCQGEELIVLDEALRQVAIGEIGDLYIRGVGLSPGYWRDEEKTQAAFLTGNDTGSDGVRMYKTGDLAKFEEDGLVYLLGRSDSQIKSRGYRIELGEIETALHTLEPIRECAVVAVPSATFEGMAICCAYVASAGSGANPTDLRAKLGDLVPTYMLPACWMELGALPLNANGKIDRPRLREQFLATAVSAAN